MAEDILKQLEIKLKERRVSVPKLGALLEIPPGRIYKWYQQNTKPKPADALKVWDWINGNENIQIYKADEDDEEPDYHKKYTALLEEVNQLKSKIINEKDSKNGVQEVSSEVNIELSLKGLSAAQVSIQQRLDVLFEAFAQVASGGDKKKEDALMIKWGKRVASMGKEKHHSGNATDDHKINR